MLIHNYADVEALMNTCGFPRQEGDFRKSVECPYVAWFRSAEEAIFADGAPVYARIKMAVELYTNKGDIFSEVKLESWFRSNDIIYDKSERVFISDQNYYETVYEFELVLV